MPYKREYHKIVCPRCHTEYQVLTPAWKRKMKDPKYGPLCTRCRGQVLWEEMDASTKEKMHLLSKNAIKERSKHITENKKLQTREHLKNSQKYWYSISDDERRDRLTKLANKFRKENGNIEDRLEIEKRLDNGVSIDYSIWDYDYRDRNIMSLMNVSYDKSSVDKLKDKFERAFGESHLCNSFYYVADYRLADNGNIYIWDYAIFSAEGVLRMVIAFDDIASEKLKSIPDGVLHCIILENKFKITFEWMLKHLMTNYWDYVIDVFKHLRAMPFPYPCYTDKELLSSWNQLVSLDCNDKDHSSLTVNTRSGDRLIQHFHHSVWHDKKDDELSPYEAWYIDDLLIKVIQNRIIYQTHLNPNKILQGFNIAKKAPKVSVFSAGRARMIIARLMQDFDTIFDPFSGYSGRMLGCISLGKRYIGQDISERHVKESNDIINFLKKYKIKFDAEVHRANTLESHGEYPCLFTCSPYSNIEQWEDVPVDFRSCDDWIDVCLENFKCKRYVFVVDKTDRYKYNIVNTIANKSHFGTNNEYIVMIDK